MSMVEALGVALGKRRARLTLATAESVRQLLTASEVLHVWLQANVLLRDSEGRTARGAGLIVWTSARVLLLPLTTAVPRCEWIRSDFNFKEAKASRRKGISAAFVFEGGELEFFQAAPAYELRRCDALLAGEMMDPPSDGWSGYPYEHKHPIIPPLGSIGNMQVYFDRLKPDQGQKIVPITSDVVAAVENTGSVAVTATRGRNMANKAIGTAVLGPVGLFGVGNAKVKEHARDGRETFLSIAGADWQLTRKYGPGLDLYAHAFAQAVNLAARLARRAPGEEAANGDDPIDRIRKLGQLRDQGLLTDAEFDHQKRKLLDAI